MPDMSELEKVPGTIKPAVKPKATRFEASDNDLPGTPPPYSSIIADAFRDIRIHKRKDKLRQIALHSVKIRAGQSQLPAGQLGREMRPAEPPEQRGGRILSDDV